MSHIKKGDRVKVDFISESATIYSGKRFTGYGVVDRFEDGYVFGRLDDGQPFMCFASDVELFKTKYNWSVIPEHVQFIATDEDGMACGWLVKPQVMGDAWRHQSHLSAFFNINARDNYLNHFRGDWKDSLEQRPGEQGQ